MVSITKSVYLFTFIFAVNLFSVNCVYKRNCEKDCSEEEKWPENLKKKFAYDTPLTNIDFWDAKVKEFDSAVKLFFNSSTILECINWGDEVICYPDFLVGDAIAGTITGGVLGNSEFSLKQIKIHASSHPGKPAGSSLGDTNDFDGPPILLELIYKNNDYPNYASALTKRDGFVQVFIGIEVVGVIDNDLASCLVAALKKIAKKDAKTHITLGSFINPFYDEIVIASSYVATVGHIQIYANGKENYKDASIVIYLARKACSWVSYKQFTEGFLQFEDQYGNPLALEQKFYEPFDCQPIVQANGITACRT